MNSISGFEPWVGHSEISRRNFWANKIFLYKKIDRYSTGSLKKCPEVDATIIQMKMDAIVDHVHYNSVDEFEPQTAIFGIKKDSLTST